MIVCAANGAVGVETYIARAIFTPFARAPAAQIAQKSPLMSAAALNSPLPLRNVTSTRRIGGRPADLPGLHCAIPCKLRCRQTLSEEISMNAIWRVALALAEAAVVKPAVAQVNFYAREDLKAGHFPLASHGHKA